MHRTLTASLLGLCLAGPVAADDWDHDANIDAAVLELVTVYRLGGIVSLERLVNGCYGLVDDQPDQDDRLRQFEYCVGMDFAAVRLDQLDTPGIGQAPSHYFAMDRMADRLRRLATFVDDPNVHDQIIRAWAQSSADALTRHGY